MERSTELSATNIGVTQIDSKLAVTAKVTAPTMRIGNDICNIELKSDGSGERLLITLPTTGKGPPDQSKTQLYDMRSIIEAIQELNRRTATFNCNVSFTSAMDAFDVAEEPGNEAFACDRTPDGLPAAHPGEAVIGVADGPYKVQLFDSDGKEIYMISEANASRTIDITLDDTQIQALYEALAVAVGAPPPS